MKISMGLNIRTLESLYGSAGPKLSRIYIVQTCTEDFRFGLMVQLYLTQKVFTDQVADRTGCARLHSELFGLYNELSFLLTGLFVSFFFSDWSLLCWPPS